MEVIKDVSKFITVELKKNDLPNNKDITASINFSLTKMLAVLSPLLADPILSFILYFL
tara:strand:- start:951 stop:1124 length:174 start_codon:yes stop_codon:yes gene_type:complete